MTRRPVARATPLAIVAALALAAGCTEAETGPDTPVAIAFDPLPFTAIVVGDTLRDSLGVVTPLRATVYNGEGNEIIDAPVRWFSLTRDTLNRATGDTVVVAVDSITGVAVAPAPSTEAIFYARRNLTATVVPQIGRLPGPSRQIPLTLRPDRLTGPARDSAITRSAAEDVIFLPSRAITVTLQHDSADAGTTFIGVRSWPVHFALEYHGTLLADSAIAWTAEPSGTRVSRVDTTDASGNASRRVWINQRALGVHGTNDPDSIVVIVTTTYKPDSPIAGSPLRIVVPINPPPPAPTVRRDGTRDEGPGT